ncbi:glycosyltransferase [Clostridioides difficile]|nr:glycosyltransferase [Clostridioides difficile]
MDSKKICFITCVSNSRDYEECLFYINNLRIPDGFSIEIIGIRDILCMSKAYNNALEKTNAKYKVYINQNTLIINQNFIYDVLDLFNSDKDIGMIGMAGVKKLPISGVWFELEEYNIVKVYNNFTREVEFICKDDIKGDYEQVEVIDGLIMITQYDIKWREDIFDNSYFYDVSQCMEFNKKKYKIIIPNLKIPWCIYLGEKINRTDIYEDYRVKFIKEYEREIYSNLPLVSILIPTYNQTLFLSQALTSALNQTYKKIEIIIGDDSTTDDVEKLVKVYMKYYNNIKYINNGGPLGGNGNINQEKILKVAKGEYISYLFHDDLHNENRIEKMMNYFMNDGSLVLVSSSMNYIDEDNNVVRKQSISSGKDIKMSGQDVIKETLVKLINFIGAPSMVIFKNIIEAEGIFTLDGNYITALVDVAAWIKLLEKGNMMYIDEVLSSFRLNKNQNSNNVLILSGSAPDWYYIIEYCYKNKLYIKNREQYDKEMLLWYKSCAYLIKMFYEYKPEEFEMNEYNRLKYEMDKLIDKCELIVKNVCNNLEN